MEKETLNSKDYRDGANGETPTDETKYEVRFSALQARHTTNHNRITLGKVLNAVKSMSESGNAYINFIGIEFSDSVFSDLITLGYSVSRSVNNFCEQVTKISW